MVRSIMYEAYCIWRYVGEIWICISTIVWVRSSGSGRVEREKVIVVDEDIDICVIKCGYRHCIIDDVKALSS